MAMNMETISIWGPILVGFILGSVFVVCYARPTFGDWLGEFLFGWLDRLAGIPRRASLPPNGARTHFDTSNAPPRPADPPPPIPATVTIPDIDGVMTTINLPKKGGGTVVEAACPGCGTLYIWDPTTSSECQKCRGTVKVVGLRAQEQQEKSDKRKIRWRMS